MILRRLDPLSCSLKRVHASMNMLFLMNKTKDQISWVSSRDLCWENKMYKRKRSIICLSLRLRQIIDLRDTDKSRYFAITEFNNRPFPSSLVPLFQSESKCDTILMEMTLICMKMKLRAELIFIRKVSHLDSLWNRGTRELGNGLLPSCLCMYILSNIFINSFVLSAMYFVQCSTRLINIYLLLY